MSLKLDLEHARRRRQRRATLSGLGTELTPSMIEETRRLCAGALPADLLSDVDVFRERPYGGHARHVLDVYTPKGESDSPRPMVLYVHGGGFVAGSKGDERSPFGPNIGAWAAGCGFVGAAMNYRLAPEASWPDGADDIAAAVQWLQQNAARFGGDPGSLVVVGQSAGAMHVADLLGRHRRLPTPRIAGAALISCLYDVGAADDVPIHRAYWGDDLTTWAGKGSVETVLETDVPLLLAVAEYDDSQFAQHAVSLADAWFTRHGAFAPMHYLAGQNHLSTVYSIGSDDDALGPLLRDFVLDCGSN
jgi:triacylglycerol lipase